MRSSPASTSRLLRRVVAGSQVSISGRFWVSTEDRSFREPRDLDQHLATLQQKKRLLTKYATFINTAAGSFGGTVFEILWARDHQYQTLPFARDLIEELVLPSLVSFSRAQLADTEEFLSIYAQHLCGVLRGGSALDKHPWGWVAKPLAFDDQERAVHLLRDLVRAVVEAGQVRDALESAVGISLEMSIDGLARAANLLSAIPDGAAGVDVGLLAACRDQQNLDALSELVSSLDGAAAAAECLDNATAGDTQQSLIEESGASAMTKVAETLRGLGREKTCRSELQQLLETGRAAEDQLANANRAFGQVLELLGCQAAATQRSVELLLHCLDLLEKAPKDVLHLRSELFEREAAGPTVRKAAAQAGSLREQRSALKVGLDVGAAASLGCARLRDDAAILDRSSLWSRWFGRDYRIAKKEYRRIALKTSEVTRGDMSRDLRELAEHLDQCARFEGHSAYREALGPLFQGLETGWDNLRRLVEWYEQVFTVLPESEAAARVFRDILLTSRSDRLRAALARLQDLHGHRQVLEKMRASFSDLLERSGATSEPSVPWAESARSLKDADSRLSGVLATLERLAIKPDLPLDQLPDLIRASGAYRQHAASVARNHVAKELLAERFAGTNTRAEMIRGTVAFADAVRNSRLPASAVTWILDGGAERLRMLRASLADATSCATAVQEIGRTIDGLCGSTTWTLRSELLSGFEGRARLALDNTEGLPHWVHFLRARSEAISRGLDKLTSLGESRVVEPEHLLPALRLAFFNTLARRLFVDHPELSLFSGLTQAETRRQFAETDRHVITLQRERAASIIDNRPVPHGNHTGPVGRWTELALINHEVKKQKRHIPIRQLMRRSGRALQAMKPCFMMGPLSVAQYLEPGRLKFDVVVMDEASQLKPEDAIGAIARGGQMVVVGDPKQLPPTNFFQRVDADDDDQGEERTVVEEGESILDVASTLYQPVRRLRWHYRSRHHSLIAFSNREFYQGDLVVFPSACHDDPGLGVRYHPVCAGAFENRRNPREAEVVVEAVLDHMETHPDESLGVVALNFEQRDLIEELLDRRLQEPSAAAYQERMESRLEPFFVKNLENVQGDERDVIFISATYGPDSRGNQYQRFGPITGPNGHRRLNVLFTRSKRRTEVFSSLDPDKIQIGGTSWGVRALKEYLTFARTGILDVARQESGRPTNDFEESVGAVLRERGFDVEPQVGVAGFFIDLGVRNPAKPGSFVLGIECDGATYHSSKSARDRDRLRQEILENLGWKLHRIWSTDWFKSRNAEIKGLVTHVESALESDPDYRRERDRARQVESIREQLVALREAEIRQAFPDSPEEKCLLRQAVLDEFVRKRPRTREDWFRMIPLELRDATDSAQIGRYLSKILEMINASFDPGS